MKDIHTKDILHRLTMVSCHPSSKPRGLLQALYSCQSQFAIKLACKDLSLSKWGFSLFCPAHRSAIMAGAEGIRATQARGSLGISNSLYKNAP